MTRLNLLRAANIALLFLFPISWFAPLLRTGLVRPRRIPWTDWTIFELDTVTIANGVATLWDSAPALALLVALAAMVAPLLKTLGLALLQFGRLPPRLAPAFSWIGKFAMADVFLLALYVLIFKGMGLGQVETAWGLGLFTACVVASIVVTVLTEKTLTA